MVMLVRLTFTNPDCCAEAPATPRPTKPATRAAPNQFFPSFMWNPPYGASWSDEAHGGVGAIGVPPTTRHTSGTRRDDVDCDPIFRGGAFTGAAFPLNSGTAAAERQTPGRGRR